MYIDPNTDGMLFQVLLVIFGVFTGAILIFYSRIKMGIARLRRTLRQRNEKDSGPDSTPRS
jgi:hypothetical protein